VITNATSVAQRLLARSPDDWWVFLELAYKTESDRRGLLRSHREAGFVSRGDTASIEFRRRLDLALDKLMLLELGLETGTLTADAPLRDVPRLRQLFESSAFVRYLDSYLALSIRFVAERLNAPHPPSVAVNELPVARPYPPPIPADRAADVEPAMAQLLDLEAELDRDVEVDEAVSFLDGFAFPGEFARYELWLRRLKTADKIDLARFQRLTRGLLRFTLRKSGFYRVLERDSLREWRPENAIRGAWSARHPLTARVGVYDLYRLAQLLRADVSPAGAVTYAEDGSWLKLLMLRALEFQTDVAALSEAEEILYGVLDYACDLVQNAADLAVDRAAAVAPAAPERPATTVNWRTTYDEELAEVARQRGERLYDHRSHFAPDPDGGEAAAAGWSRRIRTGEHVHDLVGLALSGGGIRSATFSLGVLQRLQELDLLRRVDYLSTVSGGGYIGAWLLASVRRTRYWLTQPIDWSWSISHLRRYSKYLSPRTGILSADTWTMWASWIRNAALIQLSAIVWLSFVMLVVIAGRSIFTFSAGMPAYRTIVAATLVLSGSVIFWNIAGAQAATSESLLIRIAVWPAVAGCFLASAVLWHTAPAAGTLYSQVLFPPRAEWLPPLGILAAIVFLLSIRSTSGRWLYRVVIALAATMASTIVTYLGICGVYWSYGQWRHAWYAYTVGPWLVLLAVVLGVVVMIGVHGDASADWRREWWTRLGSWMAMYGAGFLALSLATILGPLALLMLFHKSLSEWTTIEWGSVVGWIGTVVGGLFAGNRSDANPARASTWKTTAIALFARAAAFVFIVGAVCLNATLVHVLMVKIWTSASIADTVYWDNVAAVGRGNYVASAVLLFFVGLLCSARFDLNVFGLNQFYRNRLVRCYLGATRWAAGSRKPDPFTGFDADDDLPLSDLRYAKNDGMPYRGPFPIVNCSLNLGGSSDLALHTRHSASFVMTPLRLGADRPSVGYAPSAPATRRRDNGVTLGQAISISGAAASPNMGYDTSPLVAFLMTMFNVRLGWWFPNPGRKRWLDSDGLQFSLWYLVRETFGVADEKSRFVNISDGGHFENLGIYELVRRRCKVIIAVDGECDEPLAFGSLGRVVRMCQTDFGARIEIDAGSIRRAAPGGSSRAHCAVGRILYANGSLGYLVYLKASLTGDEEVDIEQYRASHPQFPHEPTSDQFFAEDQFESYRRLGHHIAETTFRGVERERDARVTVTAMATTLKDLWVPASAANVDFVPQTQALVQLWDRLRAPSLLNLFRELHALDPVAHDPTDEELCVCLELIQQMENAFLDLRLDEFWGHPDNRGWVVLFTMWAQSPVFRHAWQKYRDVFGVRFVHFCQDRLGMS